jgi:hypothetical protein
MATLGGRRGHFDCCPSLCLLLPAERQQWGRLQREFVYSRVIAPNSIATQFAVGRRGSQRRRASPGIKRAAGWSSFRPRLVGQILGDVILDTTSHNGLLRTRYAVLDGSQSLCLVFAAARFTAGAGAGLTTLSNARSNDAGSLSVSASRARARIRFARSASVSFVFLAGIGALATLRLLRMFTWHLSPLSEASPLS